MPSPTPQPAVWPSSLPAGRIRVRFRGALADRFGPGREVAVPLGGCTLAHLKASLGATAEGGAEQLAEPQARAVSEGMLLTDGAWLPPGSEVEFVSGARAA